MIHRDIKPSNIFFSPKDNFLEVEPHEIPFLHFPSHDWVLKLGDFGLVTEQDVEVSMEDIVFSYDYEESDDDSSPLVHEPVSRSKTDKVDNNNTIPIRRSRSFSCAKSRTGAVGTGMKVF